jgi:hypothetical protein
MNDDCQRYLEDPEAHPAHPEMCADCAVIAAALNADVDVDMEPLALDALPLASWEGASHRPWALVVGGAAGLIVMALVLCAAAGVSPVHVAESSLVPMNAMRRYVVGAGQWLRDASTAKQAAFGVAFIAVNALLYVLLRRAPRGIDA